VRVGFGRRIALMPLIIVLLGACSAGHHDDASSHQPATTTSATNPATVTQRSGISPSTLLCEDVLHASVVRAAATTVADVRAAGVGVVGHVYERAFPGTSGKVSAAWCILHTSTDCYDDWAVSAVRTSVHIMDAGCGWKQGGPAAGPPVWTD
jgi:hypothetical protein